MNWPLSDVIAWSILASAIISLGLILTKRSRGAKGRSRRAVKGEEQAARLLRAHGYAILDNQASHTFPILADGDLSHYEIRADFLVKRRGQVFVAEVKTGNLAPNLSHGPTRRQLLEYALAYDAEGVLLVTPGNGQIQRVQFPRLQARGKQGRLKYVLLGLLIGAPTGILGWLWMGGAW